MNSLFLFLQDRAVTWTVPKFSIPLLISCVISIQAHAIDCSSSDIQNRVYDLTTPAASAPYFNSAKYGSCASDQCKWPAPQRTDTISRYASYIVAAFNLAPEFFQNELCKIETFFIARDATLQQLNPEPWGIFGKVKKKNPHIGIPANLLDYIWIKSQYPYADLENLVVAGLLNQPPGLPMQAANWINGITYTSTDTRPELAVLAVLAHEMGHIIWWREDLLHSKVSGKYFFNYSWLNDFSAKPPTPPVVPFFHSYGLMDPDNLPNGPDLDQVIADLTEPPTAGQYPDALSHLKQIYGQQSGVSYWPSLFATVAPDEDFVETFTLWVLAYDDDTNPTKTRLTSSGITFPDGTTADILQNFGNSVMSDKRVWITSAIKWKYK